MPIAYKLFWYYIISDCDHAGIYRVNLKSFCALNEVKITSTEALRLFNSGKQRIRIITDTVWLIEDFFSFQYGKTLNPNNRVHNSILEVYKKHEVNLTSIRGLLDLKDGVKDKDINNTKSNNNKGVEKKSVPDEFIRVRDFYPGTKRDSETEFKNFQKKHADWKEVLPTLYASIENQIKSRAVKKSQDEKAFIPEWKHMGTWINNRCWTEEVGKITITTSTLPQSKKL